MGRREMIQLIKSHAENEQVLRMLRQGWRPLTREEAARKLEDEAFHPESPEKLSPDDLAGTAHGAVDARLKRNAAAMRRKAKQ